MPGAGAAEKQLLPATSSRTEELKTGEAFPKKDLTKQPLSLPLEILNPREPGRHSKRQPPALPASP
jgi:hypothetical protein